MNLVDIVRVADAGVARLRTRLGAIVAGREWESFSGDSVVEVKGWVRALMRERGKIVPGSLREGHNIWTNTGREFLALLMTYQAPAATQWRDDRVFYIGAGTGAQTEDATVTGLIAPTAYSGSTFLAPLDLTAGVSPSFPLLPARTTVMYHRVFAENEITTGVGSQVSVSELGLFTNGNQSTFAVAGRDTSMGTSGVNAKAQSPCAYKTFEALPKTDALELEVSWEIRF